MPKRKKRTRDRATTAYQVGPGTMVTLAYDLYDAEGELVEAADSTESLEFVFGYGQVAPALEQAIDGMSVGTEKRVFMPAKMAFGERDPEAILTVARDELPEDIAEGDELTAEGEDGSDVHLKVLELSDEVAVVDTNHPLAGQDVIFDLFVESVRPATETELARAVQLLASGDGQASESLIPAARLLKRRSGQACPEAEEAPPDSVPRAD